MTVPAPRLLAWCLLLAVTAAGAVLRFAHIQETSPQSCDEGYHVYEARRMVGVVQALALAQRHWRENGPATTPRLDLTPAQRRAVTALASQGPDIIYARPLHNMLIAMVSYVEGFRPWVGNLTSASLGSLSPILCGLIAARWFGAPGMVLAALFLAFSPLHLHYSRTTYADANSVLFLLLSVWLFTAFPGRALALTATTSALAGVAWGAALATSPRLLLSGAYFAVIEGFRFDRRKSPTHLLALAAGTVLVPAFIEGCYHVALALGSASGVFLVRKTYFLSFAQLLKIDANQLHGIPARLAFTRYICAFESPVLLLLVGVATAAALRARTKELLVPVILAWTGTSAADLLLKSPNLRFCLFAVPFICVAAAGGLLILWEALRARVGPRLAHALALGLTGLACLPALVPELPRDGMTGRAVTKAAQLRLIPPTSLLTRSVGEASGFLDVLAFLRREGARSVTSTHPMSLVSLVPWTELPLKLKGIQDLRTHFRNGSTHFILDHREPVDPLLWAQLQDFCRARARAIVFRDPHALNPHGSCELIVPGTPQGTPLDPTIEIFRMAEVFKTEPLPFPPSVW